jgi:hypothetical protein
MDDILDKNSDGATLYDSADEPPAASNPLRLDVIGGVGCVPFAKKKLKQLKQLMSERGLVVGDTRILVPDAASGGTVTVFVHSSPVMDLIRIRGVGEKLFIFLVYAPHVYDANEVNNPKYKILAYTLSIKDKAVTGLKAASKDLSKIVEAFNGSTSLVVQSSPDGKQHYALMPHNFSAQQYIDFSTSDGSNNYVWSSTIKEFMGRYYIGSNMAYRPNTNGKGYTKGGTWTAPVYDEKGNLVTPGLSGAYARDHCQKARHTFRTVTVKVDGKDTKKTIYDLDIESVLIGQAVFYTDLSGGDRYRPLYKNYIRYRETPAAVVIPPDETDAQRKARVDASLKDPKYIRGTLLNTDTTQGDYGKDGYALKYTVGIAALDKDKALMRDVEVKYSSETRTESVTVTRKLVTSGYQVDPRNGQSVLQGRITDTGSQIVNITVVRQQSDVKESLKIGDVSLESLTKTQKFDLAAGFETDLAGSYGTYSHNASHVVETHPEAYMSFASQSYAIRDLGGSLVSGYYSGGFPVIGEGQVLDYYQYLVKGVKQTTWGKFTAPTSYKTSIKGGGGINVLMFDNYNGDDTWIIFYKVETYNNSGEQGKPTGGVYGVFTTETLTTYKMAYRLKGGAVVNKTMATSTVSGGGKYVLGGYANLQVVAQGDPDMSRTSGEFIGAVSCQIGQGIIAYTCNVYENERKKFKRRVMGIINIDCKELKPGVVFETELKDDDARLKDFKHDRLAAVGVGAGNIAGK